MDLFGELEWRGLIYDATEGVRDELARGTLTGYVGFDPTAASLHVGSLQAIMPLARMQRFGHSPIAVVGGGTGLIGDPSGKTVERQLLTPAKVDENVAGIRRQLARFLDFDAAGNPARLINNAEWLTKLGAIEFMRDVGKHFTVNAMLAKDSVKRRLDGTEGISYTEFSYSLLQAYDFLELYRRFQCTLQMGGSDQWGNITAGMELIRRVEGARAYGVVLPLITTSSGTKFGKTEAGTVWLDPARTSPFKFYQFWLNTDDRDAIPHLKKFTFLSREEIAALEDATARAPEKREAQRVLAREVTSAVHGVDQVARAEHASMLLFGEDIATLGVDDVLAVFDDVPSTEVPSADLGGDGIGLVDLVARVKLAPSKTEARRLVESGGIYVNNRRLSDVKARLTRDQSIGGQLFLLRKGQKQNHLVRLT
jgi:tyrosyl-tRNA synthetase